MANLDFLDSRHAVHVKNDSAWAREERRLYGGDAVLTELVKWKNETDTKFEARKAQASWIGFPKTHASILAGHIVANLPIPNYGTLGEVRDRENRGGQETVAEKFHYNCDGIGADGTQLPAFVGAELQKACATGHRWTMVEMPRRVATTPVTEEEVLAGQRPFLVPYSARDVWNWEYTAGQLDWAVMRIPVGTSGVKDGVWNPAPTQNGYYLLVRKGYQGLGTGFAKGGWWLFDADKKEVGYGDWSKTGGQIPLVRLTAEASTGTKDWPAVSRSLTMELGQIAVSLMNRISERNYDASDAAKSIKFILGGEKDAHNLVVEMVDEGSYVVTVPGALNPTGGFTVPTIYDSSAGAVAAEVFTTIIQGTIAEAHEIMVRQLTSTEEASGRSKEVGFGEATSPLLSSLAANTETWLNTVVYFVELRAGAPRPSGFVTLPREFKVAPVLQKIDAAIERMQKVGAHSPTFMAKLIKDAAVDESIWPKDKTVATKAEAELVASLALARREQQSKVFDTFAKSGSLAGAAKLSDLTPAEARSLSDVEEPEPVAVPTNGTPPTNGAVPVVR